MIITSRRAIAIEDRFSRLSGVSVTAYVHDDAVEITFDGLDRWIAFSKGVRLALEDITSARVAKVDEVKPDLGWRVGGGYWPGRIATGHFTFRGRPGVRQLWCVYRDPEVLVIDTTLDRPARVVLQTPDRHDLAWLIAERIPSHH